MNEESYVPIGAARIEFALQQMDKAVSDAEEALAEAKDNRQNGALECFNQIIINTELTRYFAKHKKIRFVKTVRTLFGLGLRDSEEFVKRINTGL